MVRRFNPDRELYKIKYGKRDKIVLGIILLLVIVSISSTFALYQVRHSKRIIYTTVSDFSNKDINLAVYIDNKVADDFPKKEESYVYDKIVCDNNDDEHVKAYWNYDKWALELETSKKTKCNVYFKTGTDKSGANPPELYQGLIPVTISDTGEIKVADTNSNWYNYSEHRWANAVLIDNNMIAADLSGNENHGEIVGGAQITDEGLVLDGVDDGIFLTSSLKDLFKHSNTIQIKLKREDVNDRSIFIGNYNDNITYPYINYEIYYNSNINNAYIVYLNGPEYHGGVYTSNEFNMITYVYDQASKQIKIYCGTENVFTLSYNLSNSIDYINVYIGRDGRGGSTALKGAIEKVMIYNDALTVEEIEKNLNAQAGKIGSDGIIDDNLHLYYDFTVPQNIDTSPGASLNVDEIKQMYVWIPRYKYQLFNALPGNTSNERIINIKFEHDTETTGEVTCNISKDGNENCTNLSNGSWYTHPAFTFGSTELKGIWVGKFNTSGTIDSPTIKPNISSIGYEIFEPMFTSARNVENKYGLNNAEIDTHMMKNIEWGAEAYLTQSQYGRCNNNICEEVTYNLNADFICGYADTSYPWYTENGVKASTTGNVYGIYDMSGGRWVVTTGLRVNSDGTIVNNNIFPSESIPNLKYFDLYNDKTIGHLGDGVKETLKTSGTNGSWYGDYSVYITDINDWTARGSSYLSERWRGEGGGIFSYYPTDNYPYKTNTFMVVLTKQDSID